jgi:hypothetical protein
MTQDHPRFAVDCNAGAGWLKSRAMAIRFVELRPADSAEALNTEHIVLENDGKTPFNTRGCGMTVGRRGSAKKSELGVMDPGFLLGPGERVRMCTGNPGTEAHGKAPEDGTKNYFLFLPRPVLRGPGTVLTLTLRGLPVCKAEYDPDKPGGVGDVVVKKA